MSVLWTQRWQNVVGSAVEGGAIIEQFADLRHKTRNNSQSM